MVEVIDLLMNSPLPACQAFPSIVTDEDYAVLQDLKPTTTKMFKVTKIKGPTAVSFSVDKQHPQPNWLNYYPITALWFRKD